MSIDSIYKNICQINSELENELIVTDDEALFINSKFKLKGENTFNIDVKDDFMSIYKNIITANDILNVKLKEVDDKYNKISKDILNSFNGVVKPNKIETNDIKNIRWKTHPQFDNYKFSDNGDAVNIATNTKIKGTIDPTGIIRIKMQKDGKKMSESLHRIVAELFIENSLGHKFVYHIGNKDNNNYKNLIWVEKKRLKTKPDYRSTVKDDAEWKKYDGFDRYLFSNKGDVLNIQKQTLSVQTINKKGTVVVNLTNNDNILRYISLCLVIAKLFVDNPKNYTTVAHKNGDKTNNNYKNLIWGTVNDGDDKIDDKLTWKTHFKFTNYEISSNGDVRNLTTGKTMKREPDVYGVTNLTLIHNDKQYRCKLHRLVAEVFVDNPNNYEYVSHLDSNNLNNNYKNLSWSKQSTPINRYENMEGEEWKIISDNDKYMVSNKGRVKNKIMNSLMGQSKNGDGYMRIILDSKQYYVHVLVAKAFIANPENKLSIDHIDKIRDNNVVKNLRWSTSSEQKKNQKKRDIQKTSKIQRIDPKSDEILEIYDNIYIAIKYIIDQKLSQMEFQSSIMANIGESVRANKIGRIKTSYGYLWKYEEEHIEKEIWKSLKTIYPDSKDIQISNYGRIKKASGEIGVGSDQNGYKLMRIPKTDNSKYVHTIVAMLFVKNPNIKLYDQINHINGIKTDNRALNLEWCTNTQNCQHACDEGLSSHCIKIQATNLKTKKIQIFNSKILARKQFKICRHTLNKYIKNATPYNDTLFTLI